MSGRAKAPQRRRGASALTLVREAPESAIEGHWSRAHAFVFDVVAETLQPVRARIGDLVVVRPGHRSHPVAVMRAVNGEYQCVLLGPPDYDGIEHLRSGCALRQRYPQMPFDRDPVVYHSRQLAKHVAERGLRASQPTAPQRAE